MKEESEGDCEVSNEEWKLKNAKEGYEQLASNPVKDKDIAGDDANGDDITTLSKGISEYEISKVKNIAKLKLELAKLGEKYPLPDEFQQKSVTKKSAKNKSKVQGEEVIRRQSPRNKPR